MPKSMRNGRQGDLFGEAPVPAAPAAKRAGLIGHAELIARLARGHGERLTVLTPSLRLAQALEADVDASQVAQGLAHWEAPDILAFHLFVRRCYEEALFGPAGSSLPMLLAEPAAQLLW